MIKSFIVQIVSQGYCVFHCPQGLVKKEFVGFFCLFFKVGKGVAKKSEDKKIVRVVMNYKFLFLLTVPKYMISHTSSPLNFIHCLPLQTSITVHRIFYENQSEKFDLHL